MISVLDVLKTKIRFGTPGRIFINEHRFFRCFFVYNPKKTFVKNCFIINDNEETRGKKTVSSAKKNRRFDGRPLFGTRSFCAKRLECFKAFGL